MIKVMLVDDSAMALQVIKTILSTAPDIAVVGTACNGKEAIKLLPELKPDVLCADLKMPIMDGLALTKAVMEDFPMPILVVSTVVQTEDAENIFQLMQAGALDVYAKPRLGLNSITAKEAAGLISKIRVLAGVHVIPMKKMPVEFTQPTDAMLKMPTDGTLQIVGIGASTGGPQALHEILTRIPANFPLPIVCVQHISEGFADGLVAWLHKDCKLAVQFATTGETPSAGHIYFAPENKQLEINSQKQFVCTSPMVYGGHRPSISLTFQSLAMRFGHHAVGVLLTGMGRDGVDGLQAINQVGGITIAQDEATSVVFGMPQVAIKERAAQLVLPLPLIAPTLLTLAKKASAWPICN